MHTCSIPVLQLCTLVRFESSRVPLKFDVVLGDVAAKTCTGVALNCIAFGVPPYLRHPFPPFDSGCRQRRILRLEEVKRSILCSLLVLSWSKRLECFAKQDPGRARQSS